MRVTCLVFLLFSLFSNSSGYTQSILLDSLLKLERTSSDTPEKVKILRDIGVQYFDRNPDKALEYFKKGYELGNSIHEETYTASCYSQVAILYNNLGDINNSDAYLNKLENFAQAANKDKVWVSYYQAASLIYRKRGKLEQALASIQKNIQYNEKESSKNENLGGAYINLSNIYTELGKYELAVQNFYKALRIFDQLKNLKGQAYCYSNLANVQKQMGQNKIALINAKKALELKQKIKDERSIATSEQLLGEIYLNLNQPEKSLLHLNKSEAYFRIKNYDFNLLAVYHLKARTYNILKDKSSTAKYYDLAINLAKKLDAKQKMNNLIKEKAEYIQPKNKEVVRDKAAEDLTLARKEKDTISLLNNLNFLSKFAYQDKDYKSAYDYREEYLAIEKSISGVNVLKQVKEIESKYQLEKKENAIRLLEKDKQIDKALLKQHKLALYASLGMIVIILLSTYLLLTRIRATQRRKKRLEIETMRNNIAGDLHDEIGSTLSSIQIMSSLLAKQDSSTPKAKEIAEKIIHLSDKVANGIREIVWSVNPANDDLDSTTDYLHKVAKEILESSQMTYQFNKSLEDPKYKILPQIRKDFIMLFKEAVNNARKYSKALQVDIQIIQNKAHLLLKVKDNGCGFEINGIERGNGLNNMERRAQNMNAELIVRSELERGTLIELKIPLS